jgi:hypothetical protein
MVRFLRGEEVMKEPLNYVRGATISDCGKFRYHLWRRWQPEFPPLMLVMLNPSTADGQAEDATIRRCVSFAVAAGFGSIEVVNLFAYRATDPRELHRAGYPVGPNNDHWIRTVAKSVKLASDGAICLAWGAHAAGLERPQVVLPMLREIDPDLWCLRITRSGYPQHPLMLPSSCRPIPFTIEAVQMAMGAH